MTVSDSERRFVARLLNWYDAHGRHDLPWRASDSSAFEVLAAELMLQQTSVEQVKTVYPKFVERYRTPEAVANSTDLAGHIEPLGLAKRVEYFKRVSERLIREHDGRVPKSRSELMELHGVGEYTACSVLAHVHGQNMPAVDTNVARILSRVFGLGTADAPSNHRN